MKNIPLALLGLMLAGAPSARAVSLEASFEAASAASRLLGLAQIGAAGQRDTEEALLALLDDRDPAVRAQAAKALKNSALNNRRVEDRLRRVATSGSEDESVRVEAIKSLSLSAEQSNPVRRELIDAAQSVRNSDRVRAIACKALWTATSANDARAALTDILQDRATPAAVRAGAAWGLWKDASVTGSTSRALVDAVSDTALPAAVRAEAIKSLYTAMDGQRTIREAVQSVAESASAPASLRATAILAHHRISTEYTVQRWLQDLASSSAAPELRAAAVQSQTVGLSPELARYFHLSHWGRRFLDPLEAE